MPYIKQEMRKVVDEEIGALQNAILEACTVYNGPGESLDQDKIDGCLNYVFTKMLKYFYTHGTDAGGIPITNYTRLNRAVGLVECVKTEFERRVVAPYENTKIFENGDV